MCVTRSISFSSVVGDLACKTPQGRLFLLGYASIVLNKTLSLVCLLPYIPSHALLKRPYIVSLERRPSVLSIETARSGDRSVLKGIPDPW